MTISCLIPCLQGGDGFFARAWQKGPGASHPPDEVTNQIWNNPLTQTGHSLLKDESFYFKG
jgi:hypothetical protein